METATKVLYVGHRMFAAASRRNGFITQAATHEAQADNILALAASHDFNAEAWATLIAECDDAAAIPGDSSWAGIFDTVLVP